MGGPRPQAGRAIVSQMAELNPSVLVVDDEPYILRSLSFVLKRTGLQVFEARNGLDALDVIRRERPALVFLDIMMPNKDGYEVCREVKSEEGLADVYIVLLSAKGQEVDKDRGFEAGADEYITKPFSPSRIVEKAHAVIARICPEST